MDKFSATKDVDDIEMTNNPSSKGNEFFCRAILDSNLDEVIRLIEQVDVNTLNCNEGTPLYVASRRGNLEVVNFLLDHGADPNKATTTDGATPLFIASYFGYFPVVEALLEKGADPNKATTDDGETPLYIASEKGYFPVVIALLKKGADPNKARTDNGETPIQAATRMNDPVIANYMRDYERKNSIMATSAALYPITRDTDAALPLDLYEFMGKKNPNGNYVAGRRRRKTKKSRKSRKSKKSKKRRRL